MPKRECRLLVLSPRARNRFHVGEYKPFGRKKLIELMKEAETLAASKAIRRDYDRHTVFEGFFFGDTKIDDALQKVLRDDVPASLIDCMVYSSVEESNREMAKVALRHFRPGDKAVMVVCSDDCNLAFDFDVDPASDDSSLRAYLYARLRSPVVRQAIKVMGGIGR